MLDTSPQDYKVVHGAGVAVRSIPDTKSAKVCSLSQGQVVTTLAWDPTQTWRQVRVNGENNQLVDGWVLVENDYGMLLEKVNTPAAPAAGTTGGQQSSMDLEQMMMLHRELEEKLRAMGVPQGAPAPGPQVEDAGEEKFVPRSFKPSKFEAYAQDKGFEPEFANQAGDDAEVHGPAELPPRCTTGQLYKVVFEPKVAIRRHPSKDAPCIRCVPHGVKLELFEWDSTRVFRRVTVDRAIDPQELILDDDERPKQGTLQVDGWIMIEHPSLGLLLQACFSEEEEEEEDPSGAPVDGKEQPWGPGPWGDHVDLTNLGPQPQDPRFEQQDDGRQKAMALIPMTLEQRQMLWDQLWETHDNFSRPNLETPEMEARKRKHIQNIRYWDSELAKIEERPALREPRLMRAVRGGDIELVRSMVAEALNYKDMEVNNIDLMGETALFEATSSGRVDMMALLLLCKATPHLRSREGYSAIDVATGAPALALLQSFSYGAIAEKADKAALRIAFKNIDPKDRSRVAKELRIPEEELAMPEEEKPPEAPAQVAEAPATAAPPPTVAPAAGAPAAAAAPPAAEAAAAEAAAPPAAAIGEVDEHGNPVRIETPTLYRVVYKMVAVRRSANTKAESLRAKKLGETVEMYEYDATGLWRRVEVEVPVEGSDAVEMTDGWMLLRSDKIGILLQEVVEDAEDEEMDDEAAG